MTKTDLEFCDVVRLRAGATEGPAAVLQRLIEATDRLSAAATQLLRRNLIRDRPLDDDLNVLIARCEKREDLSLADQRELWEWLEERGSIMSDLEEQVARGARIDHE